MSLLNDVLRDLQTRGVFGVPPLAGLQPVAEIPMHQRKRALLVPAFAVLSIAAAIVLWRPVADGRWFLSFAQTAANAPTQPQVESQSDVVTSMHVEPATVAATGDDLRELFGVDNSVGPGPARHNEFVADTISSSPSTATVAAEMAAPTESREVADSSPSIASPAVVESPPQAAPAAVVASLPPTASAAPPQATGTGVMRREPAADEMQGLVARALKAMRANDLFTAESMFRAALTVESGDVDIWSYLYSVLAKTSRPEAAEQVLQQGLVAADEPAALAKLYARMLLDRGEKDAAISLLKIHRPPAASDIEYDSFLAALLQQQGQYAQAGEIYESLLAVDPGSSSIWMGLAMSHDSLGNREEALSAFERALTAGSLKPPLARYARRRSTELKTDD